MNQLFPNCQFSLPDWVSAHTWPGQILSSEQDRLAMAVELSRQQVINNTGGPFGAVVCDLQSGKVLGAGVNLVVNYNLSMLHAEVVAWSIAQQVVGSFDLGSYPQGLALYSSAQPCIGCWGGLFWTGIRRLVYGATKQDVEQLTGFREGPVPEDWQASLISQGISVANLNRDCAAEVLALYASQGGRIYNPS